MGCRCEHASSQAEGLQVHAESGEASGSIEVLLTMLCGSRHGPGRPIAEWLGFSAGRESDLFFGVAVCVMPKVMLQTVALCT